MNFSPSWESSFALMQYSMESVLPDIHLFIQAVTVGQIVPGFVWRVIWDVL